MIFGYPVDPNVTTGKFTFDMYVTELESVPRPVVSELQANFQTNNPFSNFHFQMVYYSQFLTQRMIFSRHLRHNVTTYLLT